MTFERLEDRLFLRRFDLLDVDMLEFALEPGHLGGILGPYGSPPRWGLEIGFRL